MWMEIYIEILTKLSHVYQNYFCHFLKYFKIHWKTSIHTAKSFAHRLMKGYRKYLKCICCIFCLGFTLSMRAHVKCLWQDKKGRCLNYNGRRQYISSMGRKLRWSDMVAKDWRDKGSRQTRRRWGGGEERGKGTKKNI